MSLNSLQSQLELFIEKLKHEHEQGSILNAQIQITEDELRKAKSLKQSTPVSRSNPRYSSLLYLSSSSDKLKSDNRTLRNKITVIRKGKQKLEDHINRLKRKLKHVKSDCAIIKLDSTHQNQSLDEIHHKIGRISTLSRHKSLLATRNTTELNNKYDKKAPDLKKTFSFDFYIQVDGAKCNLLAQKTENYWKEKCNAKRVELDRYQKYIRKLEKAFNRMNGKKVEELVGLVNQMEEQKIRLNKYMYEINIESFSLESENKHLQSILENNSNETKSQFEKLETTNKKLKEELNKIQHNIQNIHLKKELIRNQLKTCTPDLTNLIGLSTKARIQYRFPYIEQEEKSILKYLPVLDDFISQVLLCTSYLKKDKAPFKKTLLLPKNLITKRKFKYVFREELVDQEAVSSFHTPMNRKELKKNLSVLHSRTPI